MTVVLNNSESINTPPLTSTNITFQIKKNKYKYLSLLMCHVIKCLTSKEVWPDIEQRSIDELAKSVLEVLCCSFLLCMLKITWIIYELIMKPNNVRFSNFPSCTSKKENNNNNKFPSRY